MAELKTLGVLATKVYNVVVVGNGAAAAAVVDRLHTQCPQLRIAILGTGGVVVADHTAPLFGRVEWERDRTRRQFMVDHGVKTWDGPGLPGGVLLLCVGGSEIDGGNLFPRQQETDILGWPTAVRHALFEGGYYDRAEITKGVAPADPAGAAQATALSRLGPRGALPSPRGYAVVEGRLDRTRRNASAAARLGALAASPAVTLAHNAYVTRIVVSDGQATDVVVRDWGDPTAPELTVSGEMVVVALDPVEAVRLLLNSGLDGPGVGLGLQDHLYIRGWSAVHLGKDLGGHLDIIVPPASTRPVDRFALELKTFEPLENGRGQVRVTAMVPISADDRNSIRLSDQIDRHGARKAWVAVTMDTLDERRARRAEKTATVVARDLGGTLQLSRMPLGRSHHHAGGLSFDETGPVSADCRLKGVDNLFIAGRALLPSIGIANPVLTITALGIWLADQLAVACTSSRRLTA